MAIGFKIRKHGEVLGTSFNEMFPICDHCNQPIADFKEANVEFENKNSGKAYILHMQCSSEFRKENPNITKWSRLIDFKITSSCMP